MGPNEIVSRVSLKSKSNADIFFLSLLLLPSKLSIAHQTNAALVRIDFEDENHSSKIELLTFFASSCAARFGSDGSINFLSCGVILGVVAAMTLTLVCGFESITYLFVP